MEFFATLNQQAQFKLELLSKSTAFTISRELSLQADQIDAEEFQKHFYEDYNAHTPKAGWLVCIHVMGAFCSVQFSPKVQFLLELRFKSTAFTMLRESSENQIDAGIWKICSSRLDFPQRILQAHTVPDSLSSPVIQSEVLTCQVLYTVLYMEQKSTNSISKEESRIHKAILYVFFSLDPIYFLIIQLFSLRIAFMIY